MPEINDLETAKAEVKKHCPNPKGNPAGLVQNLYDREGFLAASSKGGKKGAITKRRRKALKLIAQAMLDAPIFEADEAQAQLIEMGFTEPTYADAMILSVLNKSLHGDVEAARFIRDTSGQKPTEQVEVGNLNGTPFMKKEMQSLTDEQLLEMIKSVDEEESFSMFE